MDALESFVRDNLDLGHSTRHRWDAGDVVETETAELDVAYACKALVKINRALRTSRLEPKLREKMERARNSVRQRLATEVH